MKFIVMKKIFFLILVFLSAIFSISAQKEINTNKKGFAADGYDVVSYFENNALVGNKKYQTALEGVKYQFSSGKNLQEFKKNSTKFIPQYGGWCSYAIGAKNEKVEINPKTFEIRDNKLYLFYNAWGTNTFKLWTEEGAEKLKKQADENWGEY
jgi:YHS domain-containing protein